MTETQERQMLEGIAQFMKEKRALGLPKRRMLPVYSRSNAFPCKRCVKGDRNPLSSAYCNDCLDYQREYTRKRSKGGTGTGGRKPIPRV